MTAKNKALAVHTLMNTDPTLLLVGVGASLDAYAAALALHFVLSAKGTSTVVSTTLPNLELSAIHGIDQVTTQFPSPNLVITLAEAVGLVEKVSYFIEGTELKLVVHPQPGAQQFNPKNITIDPGNSQVKTVVAVGISTKEEFEALLGSHRLPEDAAIVAIALEDLQFGTIQLSDTKVSSLSELTAELVEGIGMPKDTTTASDVAHNLLTGIRNGTQNFTSPKVRPETFELAARLSRKVVAAPLWEVPALGREPEAEETTVSETVPQIPVPASTPAPTAAQPTSPTPPSAGLAEPEPDWLTPKIYKGTSLL